MEWEGGCTQQKEIITKKFSNPVFLDYGVFTLIKHELFKDNHMQAETEKPLQSR
jgi:hypothetical protein